MKRVLIVDDAATVRLYLRTLLSGPDYQVDEAFNGIEALEKALEAPYDLYLVDINMPKLDGFGFLRELRSLDIPQAPAVMISTQAHQPDEDEAFRSGASAYLIKPLKPETLLGHVVELLGGGQAP